MPQAVTIQSLPSAFEFVKAMQAEGLEWGEGYRGLGREAIAAILQGQMTQAIDEHLDRMALRDEADRRNGCYRRHLLTELGGQAARCGGGCLSRPATEGSVSRADARWRRAGPQDRRRWDPPAGAGGA